MNRLAALFAALLLVSGCATVPSGTPHAPSYLPEATLASVADAARAVFEAHGWQVDEVEIDHEMLRMRSAPFTTRGIAAEYADCGVSGIRRPDEGHMELMARRVAGGVEVSVRPRVMSRESYVQDPVPCLSNGTAERSVLVALRENVGGN